MDEKILNILIKWLNIASLSTILSKTYCFKETLNKNSPPYDLPNNNSDHLFTQTIIY